MQCSILLIEIHKHRGYKAKNHSPSTLQLGSGSNLGSANQMSLTRPGRQKRGSAHISAASVLSADKHDRGVRAGHILVASCGLCKCPEPEQNLCFAGVDRRGMALIWTQRQQQQLSDHGSFLIMTVTCCDNLVALAAAGWVWSQQLPDHREAAAPSLAQFYDLGRVIPESTTSL